MELKDKILEFLKMKERNLLLLNINDDYDDGYYDGKMEIINQIRLFFESDGKQL